jgi:hypothetical protein
MNCAPAKAGAVEAKRDAANAPAFAEHDPLEM